MWQAGCQLCLIFCFIGGGYIRLFEEFSIAEGTATVQRIMVFSSTTVVALPLVIITLAMMVLMVGLMVRLIKEQGIHPSIRLTTTRMQPELTLEKGMIWHLFLSHIVCLHHTPCAHTCHYSQRPPCP